MPFEKVEKIWMNGKLVNWDDAKIHVLSHVVHYGSCIFEGARCYKTKNGPAIFRLQAHTDRLFNSCKIYRMEIPFTKEEINQVIIDLIKINKLDECYIRPVVYRGYEQLGVDPTGCPVEVCLAVWRWGAYLGPEALENGVPVCVSSWNRMAPNTMPDMAKSGANYMNAQLIKLEAKEHGYVEGIALDVFGFVSEGSGENVFIVRDGTLITPPFSASILPGITRNTVIFLALDMGIKVIEQNIPREALYIADEVFFTGSAAEISPINSIDKVQIGDGKRGPVTKELQEKFFGIVNGETEDKHNWLTYVR
ncbi:MAG: branched-chain amino acid aminotransferase [candidate division Zixibacteria bacterium SM23_73_3]|nr:MAG: branched-chain amino acid aminotransferase [candidate division Zixibacteria bacterium SM23_73_3]